MKNKNVVINNRVVLGLTQHFQHLPLSFINDLRERFQIKFGMTPLFNNGGFTLIELLVVVLIIGILAAVALPQYEVAVTKSRLTQALTMTKGIKDAELAYFLANGAYTYALDDLDVAFDTCTINADKSDTSHTRPYATYACANKITLRIFVNPTNPTSGLNTVYALLSEDENKYLGLEVRLNRDTRLCVSDFDAGKRACQTMGGTLYTTNAEGHSYYNLPSTNPL